MKKSKEKEQKNSRSRLETRRCQTGFFVLVDLAILWKVCQLSYFVEMLMNETGSDEEEKGMKGGGESSKEEVGMKGAEDMRWYEMGSHGDGRLCKRRQS